MKKTDDVCAGKRRTARPDGQRPPSVKKNNWEEGQQTHQSPADEAGATGTFLGDGTRPVMRVATVAFRPTLPSKGGRVSRSLQNSVGAVGQIRGRCVYSRGGCANRGWGGICGTKVKWPGRALPKNLMVSDGAVFDWCICFFFKTCLQHAHVQCDRFPTRPKKRPFLSRFF